MIHARRNDGTDQVPRVLARVGIQNPIVLYEDHRLVDSVPIPLYKLTSAE